MAKLEITQSPSVDTILADNSYQGQNFNFSNLGMNLELER